MNITNKFEKKVLQYIQDNKMFEKNDKVVVGVSGGADSICLLQVLYLLKIDLVAVHINHCIRGEEADKDEMFVVEECKKKNIPCIVFREKVEDIAKQRKLTEEEAGRMVRYDSFNKVMKEYSANKIAVAHHMNDSAETLLFNLFRGSGIAGLCGIKPKNNNIVRPLLCVERSEIENYLACQNIKFKNDKTNFEEEYTRNKIRLNILPYVEDNINKKAVKHMSDMAKIARESEEFFEDYVRKFFERCVKINNQDEYCINIDSFKKEKKIIQKRLVRYVINCIISRLKDIEAVHVENITKLSNMQVGKRIMLPYGVIAKKEYDCIKIFLDNSKKELNKNKVSLFYNVDVKEEYYLKFFDAYISFQIKKYEKNKTIPKNNYTKWFDYDKIYNVIRIRNREQGDFICLNPCGGKKKLKDFFIDNKVDKNVRDSIPLLTDGKHILWIIGMRSSEAYRVDESTKNILEVVLHKKD